MDRFGTDLLMQLLTTAWPHGDPRRKEPVSWNDVVKLFFENAGQIRAEALKTGCVWTVDAIEELDMALMAIAEAGQFTGEFKMSPMAAVELWRRWRYAIIAAQLEADLGAELNLTIPRDAPDTLKGLGLMLYVLGGPARDYDPAMFPNE